MSDKFTCAECGGKFDKAWSDEEAEAEYTATFPDEIAAGVERAVVCDYCYRRMMG